MGCRESQRQQRRARRGTTTGSRLFRGGIIFRFPTEDLTPFVHGLVGAARVDGPDHNPFKWGPDLTAGGGVDYETPWFNHRLAIRVFQADYEYMHADFGPGVFGGRANINAARLSGGVVFHVGTHRAAAAGDGILLGQSDFSVSWRAGHGDGNGRDAESQDARDLHLVRRWRDRATTPRPR